MPGHTLVVYGESQDTGGNLSKMAVLEDEHITSEGDDVTVPTWADKIVAAIALGATISQAQVSSPSLRKKLLLDLAALEANAAPSADPIYNDYRKAIRALVAGEELNFLVAEAAVGAEQEFGLLWLTDELMPMPEGEVLWVRATASVTLVANAWKLVTVTLDQQLEAGRYALVGLRSFSANMIATRVIIPGTGYRPGALGYSSESQKCLDIFEPGGLGNWGEFEHNLFPKLECLAGAADTSETFYFALVMVREGTV